MRLLLIEDDTDLARSIQVELEIAGFAVDLAYDGEQGEFLGATENYDIAVLDLGLPKLSGLAVLKKWRDAGNAMPVIVLTARDAWYEKVDGFKAGADDYLGKPFHIEELQARIRALLKRCHGITNTGLTCAGVTLDEELQTVTMEGQPSAQLTSLEFRLLRYFMLHSGQILTKTDLMEHVYEMDGDPDSNVIEVYVNRLRRKLGKDLIATRRGQGYVFGQTA